MYKVPRVMYICLPSNQQLLEMATNLYILIFV